MRIRVMAAAGVALAMVAFAGIACSGDDDAGDDGTATGSVGSPTATGEAFSPTPTSTAAVATSEACDLLGLADLEVVTGDVISTQDGIPDGFESCYAFTAGGEVIFEFCECLTDEEFDQEVVDDARGRGTVSESVLMVGDKAEWVPAGEQNPNTGVLWVRDGDTTLTLWLDVPIYNDIASAQADTVALMNQILAGMP